MLAVSALSLPVAAPIKQQRKDFSFHFQLRIDPLPAVFSPSLPISHPVPERCAGSGTNPVPSTPRDLGEKKGTIPHQEEGVPRVRAGKVKKID